MFFNSVPSVSVKEAYKGAKLQAAAFIDVRSPGEYASGHASGAENIPLDTLPSVVENLKRFETVYVICQSGGRSSMAASALKKAGVHAVNVSGGTSAWRSEGLPMK